MSHDPSINAAILNFCAKAGGGSVSGSTAAPAQGQEARPREEYDWLREAMASVESPERKLKKMLTFVDAYNASAFGGAAAPAEVQPDSGKPTSAAPATAKRSDATPVFASAEEKNEYLLETLEEISDMVEDINWATEFTLMQGPEKVLRFLANVCGLSGGTAVSAPPASPPAEQSAAAGVTTDITPVLAEVTTQLCMVIAHAAQLNESVQQAFLQQDWPSTLLRLLREEVAKGEGSRTAGSPSASVIAAALHACSCLCRGSSANTIAFVKAGGMDVLVALLRGAGEDGEEGRSPAPGSAAPRSFLTTKILSRLFFFATYLADSGLSAEELIDRICLHAEVPEPAGHVVAVTSGGSVRCEITYESTEEDAGPVEGPEGDAPRDDAVEGEASAGPPVLMDETAERAAAAALVALAQKSAKVVKLKARRFMPRRLREWAMVNDTEDPRRMLADLLARAD